VQITLKDTAIYGIRNNMNKDILPKNKEGRPNGYCEKYYYDGSLWWRGVILNDRYFGYHEFYTSKGTVFIDWTGYFINHNNHDVLL